MQKYHPRQHKILEMLNEQEILSVAEMQAALQTSLPTVYRDIRALVQAGQIERVTGGVMKAQNLSSPSRCSYCKAPITAKTSVSIQTKDNRQISACCPHCALLELKKQPQAISALAPDFLYGNMVNMRTAAYILESRIILCCIPSVLLFGRLEDAQRFQLGFGGDILTFEQAQERVIKQMALHNPHK